MQVIRALILAMLACLALTANAQVQQARGKATVSYAGKAVSAEDKLKANQAAQLKAVEFYFAEAGQTEAENFDNVREKILASPDRFILESTTLAEEDRPDTHQYTVTVRVSLNVANLRNLEKANSAVAKGGPASKSPLAFLFVSRMVDSTRTFDDHVYKRVDESLKAKVSARESDRGVEGESIKRGQVATTASTAKDASVAANRTATRETGGSSTRKSAESSYRLMPSANLNQIFTAAFTRAGYKVNEAAMVEPYTGGQFKVAAVEADYKSGMDLQSQTLASVVNGMRTARIPYVALGTLDVGMADKDPATGLVRVAVTVNAKILNVTETIPETVASVGPVQYSGVGPTEDEARGSALRLAASNAARELTSQVTTQQLR
jgi:hypothetical protein